MTPSRRTVLQGAASSLLLPALPSLLPREARAAVATPPRRVVAWFAPNGMLPAYARPPVGALGELPRGIAPLTAIAPRATVLSGLQNLAFDTSQAISDHTASVGSLLTDHSFDGTLAQFDASITFDQIVANTLGGATPFPSLQLGLENRAQIGDSANAEVYQGTLSWASPTQPLIPLIDPRQVFELMFGGTDSGASAAESAARQALQFSVLDRVAGRVADLSARASTADRDKLDQYLTGIRDLESRLTQLETLDCPTPLRPGDQLPLPQLHTAMRELMGIAIQCDYTRVLSFAAGMSESSLQYDHLGFTSVHHTMSHHGNGQAAIDDLVTLQAWLVEQFVALAQDLEALDDGQGGTLLDHTALLLVTEMGDANIHDTDDLTFLLAGGEAHGWVHGQHRPQVGRAHSEVFLNLMDFMGQPMDNFGEHALEPVDLG